MDMDAFASLRTKEAEVTDEPGVLTDAEVTATVLLIVLFALISITLLFGIAIFIDCRQQKVTKVRASGKLVDVKIPNFTRRLPTSADKEIIVDNMHHESSDPPV